MVIGDSTGLLGARSSHDVCNHHPNKPWDILNKANIPVTVLQVQYNTVYMDNSLFGTGHQSTIEY